MKILILIPSHSHPIYTKLTVASLKKHLKTHDLNIHIGVHSNYSHYTQDFSLFEDLRNHAQIHLVDEIDWNVHWNDNYRYSKMHCINLMNLLKNCQYYDFDYAIHLDNDVWIKDDFITSLIRDGDDLIFDFFNNENIIRKVTNERTDTGYDGRVQFAPKITAWNLIFSRKIFDRMLTDINVFYPEKVIDSDQIRWYKQFMPDLDEDVPVMFDTFSKLYFLSEHVWKDVNLRSSDGEFTKMIHHFFFSSFNYGVQISNNQDGVRKVEEIWNTEFRNGFN